MQEIGRYWNIFELAGINGKKREKNGEKREGMGRNGKEREKTNKKGEKQGVMGRNREKRGEPSP